MVNNDINMIKEFFQDDKGCLSMMRLISYTLVVSGVLIVGICVWFKLDGAHYGLELAVLGVIGKGYQKKIEEKPSREN